MALMAWLGLANHCVLGRVAAAARVAGNEHSCCHNGGGAGATQGGEQPLGGGPENLQCCKALQVILPAGVKAADLAPLTMVVALLHWEWVLAQPVSEPVLVPRDTGPPRVLSFSELVLHRSLCSHAPPVNA